MKNCVNGQISAISRKKMVVQWSCRGRACKDAGEANESFFGEEEQQRERAFRHKAETSDSKLATTK